MNLFDSMEQAEQAKALFEEQCAETIAEEGLELHWTHRGYMSSYIDQRTHDTFSGFVQGRACTALPEVVRELLREVLSQLPGDDAPGSVKERIHSLLLPTDKQLDAILLPVIRNELDRPPRVGWLVPAIKRCRAETNQDLRTCRTYVLGLCARNNILTPGYQQ